jgi:DNA-binding LacI/PurR family transcriptional regulator
MGTKAAELLMERIADQELGPRQEILEINLVIRGSTSSLPIHEGEIA